MPMTQAEVERKLRQLDNDVQSIYVSLSAIQGTQTRHTNRLQEIAEKVDGLETRLDGVDSRLGGVETRLGGVETEVRGLNQKMDTVLGLLQSR
jgi:chromosome segregation ATPase